MRIRKTHDDRVFSAFVLLYLAVAFCVVLYPLIYIISSSFSSTRAVTSGRVWLLPVEPGLTGYKAVFEYRPVWIGYLNSFIYMILGSTVNVAMTLLAAYPLSRKDLHGRGFWTFLFTFTMFFSGGLMPLYILMSNLKLLNTRWAMILPGALSVWNMIITRTYFQTTISDELREAGELDGCNDMRFFLAIVLPLSGSIIAVIWLFYAVAHWNAFFDAVIYLRTRELYPLQVFLREILVLNSIDNNMLMDVRELEAREGLRELLKYALIIVASFPMMALYPFVQKHFVKGIMIGSIKG